MWCTRSYGGLTPPCRHTTLSSLRSSLLRHAVTFKLFKKMYHSLTWTEHLNKVQKLKVRDTNVLLFLSEPSPEPEHLEQSGETVSLSDQTLPERLRLHWSTVPAQVTFCFFFFCGAECGVMSSGLCVCLCFRQEADGKLYVRYQVLGRSHVAVPTHFFKVSSPVCRWW